MYRVILCAAASAFAAGIAFGQGLSPQDGPWPRTAAPPRDSAPARADEINDLRGAIRQLQERLDRLAGEGGGTTDKQAPLDAFAVVPSFPESPAPPEKADPRWPMTAAWKDGLVIESKADGFRVHVGGQLQFDAAWNMAGKALQFGPGGTGEFQDGALFRRARVQIDGTFYEHFEWIAEFDFANSIENDIEPTPQTIGTPSFINVWIGANDIPLIGTLRAGWMKEPIGFAHLTSSRWANFMERAPGDDSLGLVSPGVLVRNHTADERMTWAAGVFHSQNDNFGFGIGDGQYDYTGRVTWLPWYEGEGAELLHLGLGATHRHLDEGQIALHGRPSVRSEPGSMEPILADTGTIGGTSQEALDAELVAVFGPWTLQSEYYCTFIHDAVVPDEPPPKGVLLGTLFYQGAYMELLYFLTGEHQPYNRQDAAFDRVVPLHNFNIWDGPRGWGAWQVGVRYSYLDLQDKGVNGATLHDLVLGLNWYLNPNLKMQWNVALDHRESTPPGSSGWTYFLGTRLALAF